MHTFTGKMILILLVLSFILGLMVILLKPDYTIKANVASNQTYYPSVKID
jgi:hypothetical protein